MRSETTRRLVRLVFAGVTLGLATVVRAQSVHWVSPRWVGSLGDADTRVAQLLGATPTSSLMLRPLTTDVARRDSGTSLGLYNPLTRVTYNSSVPYGMNDGAMWAGRGFSLDADLGAELHWRIVTARVAPTVTWSQNQAFPLAPLQFAPANPSPYADQWWSARLDRPQRFGDGSFARVDPGQSMLRIDWRALAVGAGTENMWWGPGIDNSILMSNTAAGFPHAFAGTSHPMNVGIGRLEGMYVAGRLYDSDYWRVGAQPDRNHRWLGALVFTLEPRGAPGLYLGAGRVFYEYIPAGGLAAADLFSVLQPFQKRKLVTAANPSGNDSADQLLSLFARWVFPQVGFEVYGEWGRNDHASDTRDFLLEPDHASAMLLGFQKAFMGEKGFLSVRGELTALGEGRTAELRPAPPWYAHYIVTQGYTQEGQLIGAGIGPGSDMQSLSAEWHAKTWTGGAYVERIRFDSDAFYRFYAPQGTSGNSYLRHDVSLGTGLRGSYRFPWASVSASLLRGLERNRYASYLNDVHNIHLELRTEWHHR